MTSTEEERFATLVAASHFDDGPKAEEALGALGMDTICKFIASDATFEEGAVDPNSLNTITQGMAAAVASGEDIFGKTDGSDAQKAAASSTKKSLRLLVSHCRDGYAAARERERAGPRAPHEGVDPTTRALWRKEPAQQVKRMVAVAEKMYNCDMVLASQADPSTIVSIYLDLEDGVLKLPLLRSASAWGSLSAISTESERRSGQSGTAVLLSDSAASEAEVPLRRIAQVLYLIEVALECLVVCAANSTNGKLVTHAKHPSAGNTGIVNKGEANGEQPQCKRRLPTSHSCDTCHWCVAEKHLQFTQSTRMVVMRQYVSLSGSHGVQDLTHHFQNDFLSAWKSMFEGGGHSLGSAALDIIRNAQWMKPTTALNYGQPTVDLSALAGQRTGLPSASSTAPSKSTISSKETKGADRPYGSWRVRIAGRWRQGVDHVGFAQYHGAIVKVEKGLCPATGLPTCRAVVPWWPLPNEWLEDESNPWHAIDAPEGLKGLYAFEVRGACVHAPCAVPTQLKCTAAGRSDGERPSSPEISAAKLERQLKHAHKVIADKDAKMQKLTAQAKGKGGQSRGGYSRDYGGRDYGGRDYGSRYYEADYGRSHYDDRDREYTSQRRGK